MVHVKAEATDTGPFEETSPCVKVGRSANYVGIGGRYQLPTAEH